MKFEKRMDRTLAERLNNLNLQNDKLLIARGEYLIKEAERKHFEATLIQSAEGKSQAEKSVNAQATLDWANFHRQLAILENAFRFEELRYDILDKAFQAEYLSAKLDNETIKRQGGAS
jgi:hypothetical protein